MILHLNELKGNLFRVPKLNSRLDIGVDALPQHIRHSVVLTGNDLGLLANIDEFPVNTTCAEEERMYQITHILNDEERLVSIHHYAKELLAAGDTGRAWAVLQKNYLPTNILTTK